MATDSDDSEAAADRLEAALERIAHAATRPTEEIPPPGTQEVAARLDGLIDRLRAALGSNAG